MASTDQTTTLPFSFAGLNQLSATQIIGALASLAFIIAILVGTWMWSRNIEYSVLFSNISERDGGQIIASLQQMNVPYKFTEGGGAILVPASQVHDTRLKLASQGLPKGGLVGFEVMETQKLGASQFLEQVNYQRALEGELARSIQSLQAVQGARVHLAIPKTSAFLRDEQKPTASVVLNLHPGRVLEPSQVAGIVHLVSSSVSQLTPASISVIDQSGNLISQPQDPSREASLDPTQLKFLREIESSYIRRIEAILDPVAGPGNVRAQVAADLDFSQTEQMAESYKPNPAPDAAIRSQQTAENGSTTPAASGVPGALSNQPPVPATAPITTAATSAAGGTAASSSAINTSRNATTNFELDKTITHTKGGVGSIKRLSVAVVVNNKKGPTDKDGKSKSVPYSSAELAQINALVREAMGYSKERGDTLNVANVSFTVGEKEIIPDPPLWKNPEFIAMLREGLKYLLISLVAFIMWRKILKPLYERIMHDLTVITTVKKTPQVVEEEEHVATVKKINRKQRAFEAKLEGAREMASTDPRLVADVIKGWAGGNE